MAFLVKTEEIILRRVLQKLEQDTPITSTGAGSVARAFAEAITTELGDFYKILDFNFNLESISTAAGRSLDIFGELYNVQRKSLSTVASIDASLGSFYFYLDSPAPSNIVIPLGTKIFTNAAGLGNLAFTYELVNPVVISIGRTRAFGTIRPLFSDSVFTAGVNTLTLHDFTGAPTGVTVKCVNPKPIAAQIGFELDDDYRLRVIQAVRTAGGGTSTSIRLAALGVPGVRDIVVRETPYGLGTFETIVIVESQAIAVSTLQAVRDVVNNLRPVGIGFFIREPNKVPFSINANVIVSSIPNMDLDSLSQRVQIGLIRYLNTLLVGSTLVYNQMIQSIFNVAPDIILDVTVTSFQANGQEVVRRNYVPKNDELIIPGELNLAIAQTV
jgi:uncharacterized phage protein gp47/JayE